VTAFRLIYDYTIGFALGDRASVGEQRDQAARTGVTARPIGSGDGPISG
jgi:hypothetical protein